MGKHVMHALSPKNNSLDRRVFLLCQCRLGRARIFALII
jgi:hypothetical protein